AGVRDRPLAAYAATPAGWILYPFILREVDPIAAPGLTDLTTAYGYGGPFRAGDGGDHAGAFWEAFARWAGTQGAVSEFVRCSLFEDDLLPYPGEREQKLVNVVRSLAPTEQEIWTDFDHKVRKNVAKAQRGGVTIEVDPTGARLDDFFGIYERTMDRREARRGYYFPRTFFESIAAELPGQFVYLHALLAGRVVSTELALVSAHHVYSFLGGTDEAAFDQRPNDLLKHELILWAKRAGKRRFVLGGGYAVDDGIFRYKKAFAPTGMMPFFVGRRVLDPARYDELVAARGVAGRALDPTWQPEPGFFPAYRAQLPL
ncbi:MAG: GNAT family N-acetyltransferase, partial [Proteobacteria bacterium]|nr:GNAT family N-acetyltransferase [Pseudomonadota bacterium]